MDDHALVELDPLLSRAAADHAALRAELGVLETFLATYAAQSGEERAWLREARSIHAELDRELLAHLATEDHLLLPYARRLAAAARQGTHLAPPAFRTAHNPIQVLVREHEAVDIYSTRLSQLICEPGLPDAVAPGRAAIGTLRTILLEHVAREQDVLFPAVLELERRVLR